MMSGHFLGVIRLECRLSYMALSESEPEVDADGRGGFRGRSSCEKPARLPRGLFAEKAGLFPHTMQPCRLPCIPCGMGLSSGLAVLLLCILYAH